MSLKTHLKKSGKWLWCPITSTCKPRRRSEDPWRAEFCVGREFGWLHVHFERKTKIGVGWTKKENCKKIVIINFQFFYERKNNFWKQNTKVTLFFVVFRKFFNNLSTLSIFHCPYFNHFAKMEEQWGKCKSISERSISTQP